MQTTLRSSPLALLVKILAFAHICAIQSLYASPAQHSPPQAPKTITEQAQNHLKASRADLAEDLLSKHLQSQPDAADAAECSFMLGQAQAKQNRIDEALKSFSTTAFRHPESEWAAQAIAEQIPILLERRNPSAAQRCRTQLLSQYPQSPATAKIWGTIADDLFSEEKFKEAASIYQKIQTSLTPDSLERFKLAEVMMSSAGDPEKLLHIAEQAIKEDRIAFATRLLEQMAKSPNANRHLNRIQTQLGWCLYLNPDGKHLDRAESLWREVIKQSKPADPWHAESKWHLVQLHAGPKNDWKQAVSICSEIIKEQAVGSLANEQAMFVKAWLLTVQDQGAAAVTAFDELAAAYPEKMNHQPIIQHRERALKSAASQSKNQP